MQNFAKLKEGFLKIKQKSCCKVNKLLEVKLSNLEETPCHIIEGLIAMKIPSDKCFQFFDI